MPTPPSPPWLRLLGLVLLAHWALLSTWTPSVRPPMGASSPVRYWSTRAVVPTAVAGADDVAGPAPQPPAAAAPLAAPQTPASTRTHAPRRSPAPSPMARLAPRAERASARVAEVAPAAPSPATPIGPTAPAAQAPASLSAEDRPAPRQSADTAASADLPIVQLPQAAALAYAVTGTARGVAYEARSQLRWRPEAGRYEAEWLTQGDTPKSERRWRSQGLITSTGLMPERFAEKSRTERAAHFDAEGGRVRFSANTPDAAWAPGGQDRLSAVLQLAALIASAPQRYPPGSSLTLQTAGARDALPWQWTVQDDDTLIVDGQSVPCTVLVHAPQHPYEPTTVLWLARSLHYLPARLRTTSAQGDVVEHNLQNLSPTP